jgi:hypothetical protein
MIRVNVYDATQTLSTIYRELNGRQIAKATSLAMNKTLLKGRTVARTAVKRVYNIPQKNLSGIGITKARVTFLQGAITASTKPIPMDAFNPKFEFVSSDNRSSTLSVSRRGILQERANKRTRNKTGVSIEVKKGERVTVPYAFLIPNAKPRVFARGEYKSGNGSYGFVQRHTRQENDSGNDAVKPLTSVTIFGAVINPLVKQNIARVVREDYSKNMIAALRYQVSLIH